MRNSFKNFRRNPSVKRKRSKSPEPYEKVDERPSKRLDLEFMDEDDDEYDDAVQELQVECSKATKKINQVKIKDLMEKTFKQRRKWIVNDRPLVLEVIERFPPLSNSTNVSYLRPEWKIIFFLIFFLQLRREFKKLLCLTDSITTLMDSWSLWESKIINYAEIESPNRRAIKDILNVLKEKNEEIVDISG